MASTLDLTCYTLTNNKLFLCDLLLNFYIWVKYFIKYFVDLMHEILLRYCAISSNHKSNPCLIFSHTLIVSLLLIYIYFVHYFFSITYCYAWFWRNCKLMKMYTNNNDVSHFRARMCFNLWNLTLRIAVNNWFDGRSY